LIQAQYNAALQDPPWEESNTFDIDDRPKKKRRQWYYEVVAPDGKVVDVIDEELKPEKEEKRRSSRTRSTNRSTSRSSTLPEESAAPKESGQEPLSQQGSTRRLSPSRSVNTRRSHSYTPQPARTSIANPHEEAVESLSLAKEPCRSSRFHVDNTTHSRSCTPHESEIILEPIEQTITTTRDSFHPEKEDLRRSSRSRSTNTTNSRSSTPKSTESSLTSLSSTTPELPEASIQELSQLTIDTDQSELSQVFSEDPSSSTEPSFTSSASLSRTASDISTRTLPNLKGRDLFDCRIWSNPFETSIFYMFVSSLREKIKNVKTTTETHKFIRVLRDGGRLVRNYTQNIDMFEKREGLCQELDQGPGSKGRFNSKFQKEARQSGVERYDNRLGGCEVVALHGSLERLRCNLCGQSSSWDEPHLLAATYAGTAPDCQRCTDSHSHRTSRGRRGLAIGRLRPDIVLYGEDHPHSNLISPIVTHDLNLSPDILLIMGTSLRVHGLKVMIREFAKAVHMKGGKVVFVNQTKPSESTWGEFIDYWVAWDCDEWVMDLRDRREDIWTGVTEEKCKEPTTETKRWRPQALRDDKINGVYLTFKILDTLSKVPDASGHLATRFPYWQSRSIARVSDVSIPEQKKGLSKKAPSAKKTDMPPPPKKPSTTKPKSQKRKQPEPEVKPKDNAELVAKIWANLCKLSSHIPRAPPELQLPFSKLPVNSSDFHTSFAFAGKSNHLPDVGGSSWAYDKMNLITLPPVGVAEHIHTPPKAEQPKVEERPRPRHSYGTRARGRFSDAETVVVDSTEPAVKLHDDTIVVAEEPKTPESGRIKRSCSIGALVSSSPEQWHDAPEVMT
jgi:NAD-dependent SIR2 family protein deacetylase